MKKEMLKKEMLKKEMLKKEMCKKANISQHPAVPTNAQQTHRCVPSIA